MPFEVARDQRALPVIGMHQVGGPILVDQSSGQLCGGVGEGGEPDIVVAPVGPAAVGIGRPLAFVQLRAANDVIGQTVRGVPKGDFKGRE